MASKTRKKLRVLLLADESLLPPDNASLLSPEEILPFKNEYHVITALSSMGHDVKLVGVTQDMRVLRLAADEFNPHIVFNLLVEMHGYSMFEPHVVSYLELIRQPYTGCNPRGLMLAHDKALTKKILAYHRIAIPEFAVFPYRRMRRNLRNLKFPLLVKSLIEEGSEAISRASLVQNEEALMERVEFVHRKTRGAAIAEQYIPGREIYASVLGNQRLRTFTPWELFMEKLPDGVPNIATSRMKWNRKYQKKIGVVTREADLAKEQRAVIDRLSTRIFRILSLSGYARLDFRLAEDGTLYLIEANPNPDISNDEDFAEAANHAGVGYEDLLQKIMSFGMRYRPNW
jgi:D-alanine-D-alanine ligase